MNKFKRTKSLLSFALALVLCFLHIPSVVFSSGSTKVTGTEESPAKAGITKVLKIPEGTTNPNIEFKFLVKSTSVDGATGTASNMPTIGTGAGTTGTVSFGNSSGYEIANSGGITTLTKEINLFDGVNFPHADVYVYTVTEKSTDIYTIPAQTQTLSFSPAVYTVTTYVKNGINKCYVSDITVSIGNTADIGKTSTNEKIDPTYSNDSSGGDITFTSYFTKTGGEITDPEDPTDEELMDLVPLTIKKMVTGDYAGYARDFELSVTLAALSIFDQSKIFNGYIVSNDGTGDSVLADPTALTMFLEVMVYQITKQVTNILNFLAEQKLRSSLSIIKDLCLQIHLLEQPTP